MNDSAALLTAGEGEPGSGYRIDRLQTPIRLRDGTRVYFIVQTPGGVTNSEIRIGLDIENTFDYIRFVRGNGAWVSTTNVGGVYASKATFEPQDQLRRVFCIELVNDASAPIANFYVSNGSSWTLARKTTHALPTSLFQSTQSAAVVSAEITSLESGGDALRVDDIYIIPPGY